MAGEVADMAIKYITLTVWATAAFLIMRAECLFVSDRWPWTAVLPFCLEQWLYLSEPTILGFVQKL